MKKNWMQLLSLMLCVVLLGTVIWQGRTAGALQSQLDSLAEILEKQTLRTERLGEQVAELRKTISEGAFCEDWSIQTSEVDAGRREITLDVSVTVNRDVQYSSITVVAHRPGVTPGRNEQWPWVYDWNGTGGVLTGSMTLPFDEDSPVALTLIYEKGGKQYSQELCSYASMTALLPVSVAENWGEMGYDMSGDGRMYQAHRTVTLANGISVQDGSFRIEKNGVTALEAPAEAMKEAGVYSGIQLEGEGVVCAPKDRVELHFACTDQFGIGYDFTLRAWEINSAKKAVEVWPSAEMLALTWPE